MILGAAGFVGQWWETLVSRCQLWAERGSCISLANSESPGQVGGGRPDGGSLPAVCARASVLLWDAGILASRTMTEALGMEEQVFLGANFAKHEQVCITLLPGRGPAFCPLQPQQRQPEYLIS